MEDTKIHTTVFVPLKDGTIRLVADPESKKKKLQKLTDGPARKAGLVILLGIAIFTTWYIRDQWQKSGPIDFGAWTNTSVVANDPVLVVTHEWSATTYVDTTKTRRSVSDPISALMEIRDPRNPARVILLDGSAHIPPEWDQIQWRLPDTEHIPSAKLTIR